MKIQIFCRWHASDWGKCDGCENHPGFKHRLVECVKDSPFSDSVIITEDQFCKTEKPLDKEDCISKEPCLKSESSIDSKDDIIIPHGNASNKDKSTEIKEDSCDEKKAGSLVVDKVPAEKLKVYEIPLIEDKKEMNMSDSALEAVGDSVPSIVDESKTKELKGEEALKELKEARRLNEEKQNKDDDSSESDNPCKNNLNSDIRGIGRFKNFRGFPFNIRNRHVGKFYGGKKFRKDYYKGRNEKINNKIFLDCKFRRNK